MSAELNPSADGSVALSVVDALTACRTQEEFADVLCALLKSRYPQAEVAVVIDPETGDQTELQRLASHAWQTGHSSQADDGGMAVLGTDGEHAQVALAVRPLPADVHLAALAHVAARLLPGIRALEHAHPSLARDRQPVVQQVRELDRRARQDGEFVVAGVVDLSVDPSLPDDELPHERARLKHRLRQILRPHDQVWEMGDRLVVAQVLPEPDSGMLVERLTAAVKSVHAEAGVARRVVDAWATARGMGGHRIADLITRADQGLSRMAALRAVGHRILAGEDPQSAYADLGDTLSAVVVVDSQRMLRSVNPATMSLFPEFSAPAPRAAVDIDDLVFYHPDGALLTDDEVPGVIALTTGVSVQDRLIGVRYAHNAMHWALFTAVAVSDEVGRMQGYVAEIVLVDLPGRPVAPERLRDASDLVRSPMVFMTPDVDDAGEVVDFRVQGVNCAALRALNLREEHAVGAAESELYPSEERLGLVMDYAGVVATGQATRQVVAIPEGKLTGSYEVTAEPCGDGVIVVAHSLARGSRRGETARLWDSLTGLASRQGLLMRMEDLQRQGPSQPMSLILCDIDDFTGVNDSLGRLRSDRYLVEVGRTLAQLAGPHDVVARIGSDEYAFLTSSASTPAAAQDLAETIRRTLKAGVRVGDQRLTAAASVGVAWTPVADRTSELLPVAGMAMYRSKSAGGDCVTLGRDRKGGVGAVELESELRIALEQQQFVLHYQPVVGLADRKVRGVEALIRWQHPTRGLVMPADFIAVAERRHLMTDIGNWVIEEVCEQIRRWRDVVGFEPRVSINVSTGQLARPGLATAIARRAADAGISPATLQLEITESQLLNVDHSTLSHLTACRDAGSALAIDDFGTGHAGFDYLRRIPAQILKIDKTFIDGLGIDPTDTAIVNGVIAVGHGLGLSLVAEGVEQERQADLLAELACDAAQGWLWSPAVPADDVVPMLRSGL